jgi:NADPH:quinone reductase-like Zn-dependent oxidoreductase
LRSTQDATRLVETSATSVNPIDWKVRSGARQKDFPLKLPAILGRDVSGVVRAVGRNIRAFKPGDRVLALTSETYAELVAVEASVLTHLPDGLNLVDSAVLPLVVLTGDQLVRLAARAQPGQTLLVSGALGSVGRAAVHTAKRLGVNVIAGVRARQLAEARTLGVSNTVAIDDDASKVREFADDVRDGKLLLPISRRMPLRDAGEAHALAQRGGLGKIVLVCR